MNEAFGLEAATNFMRDAIGVDKNDVGGNYSEMQWRKLEEILLAQYESDPVKAAGLRKRNLV